jgi:hypothetical protein
VSFRYAVIVIALSGAARASGWQADCGTPIEGLDPLIAPGHTLVLGEIHGTREVPAFVASAVCQAAHGWPVVLGLEMPAQPQFEAYLESDGGPQAQQALLAAPFWTAAYQDGRENVAALGLIERVRALKKQGRPIELLLFDVQPEDVKQRDQLMAEKVIAHHAKHPHFTYVLVMGNLHARKKRGSPWKPDDGYEWLTSRLKWPVVSLNAGHDDGTAWICMSGKAEECGPKVVAARDSLGRRAVKLAPSKDGYDGVFDVGSFTVSPPAAFPEKAVGLDEKIKALMNGPELLAARGRRAAMKGDFETCARMLGEVPNPDDGVLYDRACCLSQANHLDEAFDSLTRALAAGFNDDKTLQSDTDLANLRKDPRWATLKKK